MAIPKKIHYIWVGPNKMGKIQKKCLESWGKYAPDYEIKLWNEDNFPLMDHPYIKEMYRKRKWAFVSDFMRFWILYNEGGIYLDTDMELLKPIDEFLENRLFFAKGPDDFISCGIIGAQKENGFIKKVLDFYLNDKERSTKNTSPRVVTMLYEKFPAKEKIKIYPSELFYPCLPEEWFCDKDKLRKAYGRHHWSESWVSFRILRKVLRKAKITPFIKKLIVNLYEKK